VGLLMIAMRSQSTPAHEHGLADLAAQQFGVVSRGQLHALGFTNGAIQRNVAAGRLHRRHRGVYSVGHTLISRHGAYLAAVLACGPGAVLSYRSAAALWGLRPSDASRIDVTVPHTCGVRTSAAIVVHRSRRPVKATTHDGIPVTTPGQTLADLATALPRRALEKVAEAAEANRLHVEVDAAHPGAKRLDEVLAAHDLDTTTRSGLEDALLALCDAHGIPRPLVNARVAGFEVDFCWSDERLIVETDGRHHQTRAAFERDRARDALLTALGWRVMRFTARQVRRGPGGVAALVLSARSPSLATPG
jgi:hypothetical protein